MRTRRDNLVRALANFDAATIATTHGFCQEVLGGLGIAGDVAADTVFVEDLSDLLEEVVDDLYVRRFHARDTPDFTRAQAMRIALMAVNNPAARIDSTRSSMVTVHSRAGSRILPMRPARHAP